MSDTFVVQAFVPVGFETYIVGFLSFLFLCLASWFVGEGGEILGEKYDASIIGGLVIAWLNTGSSIDFFHLTIFHLFPFFIY